MLIESVVTTEQISRESGQELKSKTDNDLVLMFFDSAFYRRANDDLKDVEELIEHFLTVGWRESRDPAPWFSVEKYLKQNEDVRRAGGNPFIHYLRFGRSENRPIARSEAANRLDAIPITDVDDHDKEACILARCRALIPVDWYWSTYPDVAEAGIEPVEHYLSTGWKNGRTSNPLFDEHWYGLTYMQGLRGLMPPLRHYVETGISEGYRFNFATDPAFIRRNNNLAPTQCAMLFLMNNPETDQLSSWFSRQNYLKLNKDLVSPNPEMHYCYQGLLEGRRIGADCRVVETTPANVRKPETNPHQELVWSFEKEDKHYIVIRSVIPHLVIKQIEEQALLEPQLYAIGRDAIPNLPQYYSADIDRRSLIDYKKLLRDVPRHQDAIIVLPRLQLGGAERYAANLAWGLRQNGLRDCTVVTTDAWESDDRAALPLELFNGMAGCQLASLHEAIRRHWSPELVLALLMLRAEPSHLFVINSDLALRMLRDFGKPLSSTTKLYATFFSESPDAKGAPYSVRYLKDVIPHAQIISDNQAALDTWLSRSSAALSDRFRLLPSLVSEPGQREFDARRRRREASSRHQPAAIWYSRWEPFKAPEVLCRIAEARPRLTIDAFGSTDGTFDKRALPRNLRHLGVSQGLNRIDTTAYDLFIFTSRFEGMPNAVLEMAMAGVPIIASDVGGLRECFGNGEIVLVSMEGSDAEIAERFLRGVDQLLRETPAERSGRITAARRAVEKRHGPEVFLAELAKLVQ